MKATWIDNMIEAMIGLEKSMDSAVKELGKQMVYDITGIPRPSKWQRIKSAALEFIITLW